MAGCTGWQSVNPACQVGHLLGNAAKGVGQDVFSSIAHYFAKVASAMTSWLWRELDAATSIDLTTTSIKTDLIATGAIAALVTFALFLIQVIASVLRQDPGGLVRAVRGLGVAFIGAAFAIASTQLLLAAVDGLCNAVVQFALGTDMSGMGSKLVAASTLTGIHNPAGLLLISLVLIAAVVIVWVALMIRKMLIIVAAVFAPIAFSGAASDVSRSWVRRWIEFTVALIFSKLILVIIFMIGLSVLDGVGSNSGSGHHGVSQSVTDLAVGTLTLLLAGFAPWLAIKMVHFAGDSFHVAHAQAGAATAGARTMVAAPQKAASSYQRHRAVLPTGAGGSRAKPATGGTAAGAGGPTGQTKPSGSPSSAGSTSATGGASSSAGPAAGSAGAVPVAAAVAAPRAAGAAMRKTTERGIQTGETSSQPNRPSAQN
jgi:hypothetical protein